jgi:hypothetical protein
MVVRAVDICRVCFMTSIMKASCPGKHVRLPMTFILESARENIINFTTSYREIQFKDNLNTLVF